MEACGAGGGGCVWGGVGGVAGGGVGAGGACGRAGAAREHYLLEERKACGR